jgi:regulator of chromosome condensation
VKQIACGDFHTMAILNNGTTWGWGCSTMNHFPMKLEEIRKYSYNGDGTSAISRIIHPIEIEILKGIESIIVGSSFSIGIFSKDRVCIWGENLKQFGLPSYGELAFLRSEDPLLNFIPSMKHGHSHFLSVLDGNIYSWGDNIVGQLGYGSGDHKDYIFPAIMPKLEAFKIALSRAPTDILI